jgi:predicted TIM-barrel fold metal-dependent hydrolase
MLQIAIRPDVDTTVHEKPPLLCYNSFMIIDFHTHIFSLSVKTNREKYINRDPLFASLYSSPKANIATADDLISIMDTHGIDKSVVLNIDWNSPELCVETNDYIMESVARYPERLVGFGMVRLDSCDLAIKELERCVKGHLKGVGEVRPPVHLLHDRTLLSPVIDYIQEQGLILLMHSSEPVGHLYPGKGDLTPGELYPFLAEFPGLKLVCAHWGGGMAFYSLMPEVKIALKNVYFDTAASPFLYSPEVYRETARLAGSEKILFGTDYPLLTPRRLLNEIESLNLAEEIKNKILYENASRLLNIDKK